MKSLVQYLLAIALVLLGIALLCRPSRPAETTSLIQAAPAGDSQTVEYPMQGPAMWLA